MSSSASSWPSAADCCRRTEGRRGPEAETQTVVHDAAPGWGVSPCPHPAAAPLRGELEEEGGVGEEEKVAARGRDACRGSPVELWVERRCRS